MRVIQALMLYRYKHWLKSELLYKHGFFVHFVKVTL